MKTVVIVAPQFAPCSYPPAIRVRFFTNHLKEFGWYPIVLSVEPEYMEEPPDWEFTRMIPDDLEIIRVKTLPQKLTRKIGIGDLGIRCFPYMLRELKQLCSKRHIDMLFIPGPPWHTFLLGPEIKRQFNIPFVIDYIDPWVSSWGQGEPLWKKAFWYRQMAIWLEPYAVRHADHITSVSEGTNNGVRSRYSFIQPGQFTEIPYGGEPKDFEHLRRHPRPNPFWNKNDGKFHLSYVGAMLPKAYGTLKAIFSALLLIHKRHPDLYESVRFHFFGTTYAPNPKEGLVMPVAREMGLSDIVSEHPKRVPYLDAANILCKSDAIFAMGTSEPHYTASKIFPCILAKKPLLAVYHEASSVVEILLKTGVGKLVTYSETAPVETQVKTIYEALISLIKASKHNIFPSDSSLFDEFTARTMTRKLTESFEKVCEAKNIP
ncbi:MAG: glycosyltransferase family 4 protein [Desulfobacterales bacterium]|nr:glycosyltransferase family 4 protein [Desulfobacterales bacterium]